MSGKRYESAGKAMFLGILGPSLRFLECSFNTTYAGQHKIPSLNLKFLPLLLLE